MKKILLFIASLLAILLSSSIVSAETKYTYYWGQGCSFCANVNAYFSGVEDISKINMERKEVYYNKQNAKDMSDHVEKLGVKNAGVPFLIINTDGKETFLNGDTPIIEYFKPILGESKKDNKKAIAIIIIGLILILIPIMILKGGKK